MRGFGPRDLLQDAAAKEVREAGGFVSTHDNSPTAPLRSGSGWFERRTLVPAELGVIRELRYRSKLLRSSATDESGNARWTSSEISESAPGRSPTWVRKR